MFSVDNELTVVWKEAKKNGSEKVQWNGQKRKGNGHVKEGTFQGVIVGDAELEEYEEEVKSTVEKDMVEKAVVYDDIKIDKKENDILCLPPDHTIFPRVDIEEFNTEMEKCVIKCIWEANRVQRKSEENKAMEEASDESKSKFEKKDNKVYDNELRSLNFKNLKPTDFKNNKRIVIPDLEDDPEEIRRNNLKNELRKVVIKYKKEHCDKSGNVFDNNLKEEQLKDIKNLKERIKEEGLICGETDKTGKLTLDTLRNMSKKMDKHIKDDKIINEKEARKLENKMNKHMQFWVGILKPGETNNQMRRVKSNLITKDSQIPLLRGTSKDHKEAMDKKVGPDLRPIMGAMVGPNIGLSEMEVF